MQAIELRSYQEEAVEQLRQGLREGHLRQMLYMPTGAGKTITAASFFESAKAKRRSAVFLVDRIVLVNQASKELWKYGIDHGIVQGDNSRRVGHPILVASAQTLEKRSWWMGGERKIDLVVVDEAHVQRQKILEQLIEAGIPTIGLSASPVTPGLGKIFSKVVNVATTNNLIDQGHLAPLFVVITKEIDTRGIKVQAGEWLSKQLGERVRQITGDIIGTYFSQTERHFGGPVKTIVFTADVADAERLTEEFCNRGLAFECVSYHDSSDEQEQKIERHRRGETLGLVSCAVLQRGYDVPDIECIVDAHPYRHSLASVIQQNGRGMRSAPGKKYCLLLDFAGNYLGFEDRILEIYEHGINVMDDGTKKQSESRQKEPRKPCICGTVVPKGAKVCPGCGREIKRKSSVEKVAGKEQEIGFLSGGYEVDPKNNPLINKDLAWAELIAISLRRNKSEEQARAFCQAQYRTLFGERRKQQFNWADAATATGDKEFALKIRRQVAHYMLKNGRWKKGSKAHG